MSCCGRHCACKGTEETVEFAVATVEAILAGEPELVREQVAARLLKPRD